VDRCQGRDRGLHPVGLGEVGDAHVDVDARLGGHDVVGGPRLGDGRRDGRAGARPPDLVDGEDLVRRLDQGVDALLRLEPGVRGPPVHDHVEVAGALAADLDRPTVGRRLEDEHGTARPSA
jgi:hypothetical protein